MSGIYAGASQSFATAALNWTSASFLAMLVGNGYAPDYTSHSTLNDVTLSARQSALLPLTGTTVVGGKCKAANMVWPAVIATQPIIGVVIVRDNGGASSTFPLIAFMDNGFGFGSVPQNDDVTVIWDSTFHGLFSL